MKRIMIGSCGGLTGLYLSRYYKNMNYYVLGGDISDVNVTKKFIDKLIILPRSDNDEFIYNLIDELNKNQVEYYIPTHSKEVAVVSKNESILQKKWGGKFIISPYNTYLELDNKKKANINLKKLNIPVPKLIKNIENVNFPIFLKPNIASGSFGSYLVENKNKYLDYLNMYPNSSFYEYINGQEYTVDCIFNNQGNLVGYNQRKRMKNLGGAVVISENDNKYNIIPYIEKISNKFTIKGCVNFQYILQNNIPYFIDVNLRFASGGLPLTVETGIDIPTMLIDIMDNKLINGVQVFKESKKRMYRYFEEIYEEYV